MSPAIALVASWTLIIPHRDQAPILPPPEIYQTIDDHTVSVPGTWDLVIVSHAGTLSIVRGMTQSECTAVARKLPTNRTAWDSDQSYGAASAECIAVTP